MPHSQHRFLIAQVIDIANVYDRFCVLISSQYWRVLLVVAWRRARYSRAIFNALHRSMSLSHLHKFLVQAMHSWNIKLQKSVHVKSAYKNVYVMFKFNAEPVTVHWSKSRSKNNNCECLWFFFSRSSFAAKHQFENNQTDSFFGHCPLTIIDPSAQCVTMPSWSRAFYGVWCFKL